MELIREETPTDWGAIRTLNATAFRTDAEARLVDAPSRQGCGIGTRLVRRGLERLRVAGHPLCVVLGHPGFYPRFGFERASQFGIYWERKAPDEHFFVLELIRGALRDASGVVRYSPEFAIV